MIRQSLMAILKNGTQFLEPLTENISVLKNAVRNKSGILSKQSGFIRRCNFRSIQQHPSKSQAVSPFSRYFSSLRSNEKILSILRRHCPEHLTLKGFLQSQGNFASRYFGRPISLVAFGFTAIGLKASPENEYFVHDQICNQIKNYFQNNSTCGTDRHLGETIESYKFGEMIDKGCNAAVYAASLKRDSELEQTIDEHHLMMEISLDDNDYDDGNIEDLTLTDNTTSFEVIEENYVATDEDSASLYSSEDSIEVLEGSETESDALLLHNPDNGDLLVIEADDYDERDSVQLDLKENDTISLSSGESTDSFNSLGNLNLQENEINPVENHKLAIKMMYNYDTSNELAILNNMKMETLPLRNDITGIGDEIWEKRNHVKKKSLPPHPNIVEMYHVFFGEVPELQSCMEQYPTALPLRINPDGYGRNKTMFSVMKRYPYTLKTYLSMNTPSLIESVSMLSQLVDAVAHMVDNGIAHRDLKSDNILVEETPSGPHLVVCDFGCAMADGLVLHLSSDYVCRGGNAQLMAPEVIKAQPGPSCYVDYSKSDLWAVGTLAYEIFGGCNPFYRGPGTRLRNTEYLNSDVPDFPAHVPSCVNSLVKSMLKCDPKERPTAREVSDALHYLRWSQAVRGLSSTESNAENHIFAENLLPKSDIHLTRWLLLLSAHVILGQRLYKQQKFEIEAKKRFLSNVSINELKRAVRLFESCAM